MIKQLDSVILFLIDQTSKVSKRYAQKEMDSLGLGITVDQWVLLKIIDENDRLSQKELSDKSIRDGASITRTLDILEKKNFAERIPIPNNRRQYNISLTNGGRKFIRKNMATVLEQRARSTTGFTKKEVESLKDMLLRIQNNMS